jgi:hypothetical protein
MRDDRIRRLLGRRAAGFAGVSRREPRRIRVEAEADLAAALFDERRQPICERRAAQISP